MQGVALGTTTQAQWKQMGAAIVAGVEAGWVNPVINKVRERRGSTESCAICAVAGVQHGAGSPGPPRHHPQQGSQGQTGSQSSPRLKRQSSVVFILCIYVTFYVTLICKYFPTSQKKTSRIIYITFIHFHKSSPYSIKMKKKRVFKKHLVFTSWSKSL